MRFTAAMALLVSSMTFSAQAAENISAEQLVRNAKSAFIEGDFRQAEKLFHKAVQLDVTNADYRAWLGQSYERLAEQASFPLALTGKARLSFEQALQLDPRNATALEALIELEQNPIGLCQGNLQWASALIDRLAQIDPIAAKEKRVYLQDAVADSQRPGQRALCGPVKLTRVFVHHATPIPALQKADSTSQPAALDSDAVIAKR